MPARNRNLHAINFHANKCKKITTVQGMRKTFLLHAVLFCNYQLSICIQLLPKVIKKIAQRKQKWKTTQIMISPSGQVKHYYKRKFKVAPECLQMATPPHMLEQQRTGRISSQVTLEIKHQHVHQKATILLLKWHEKGCHVSVFTRKAKQNVIMEISKYWNVNMLA